MCRNSVDDQPEAIFALLQGGVEILQAASSVVEDLAEVSEFIFTGYRNLMLKVAPCQCLGPFHQSRQWLSDAAGNGQAKGSGDQQREDRGQRHNPKNETSHAPNVPHGFSLLFAGLVLDFLDERRGQVFQRPYLVRKAQTHSPPVAGCCECGDSLKLRWQRALNDAKGRQDGRISPE